MKYERCVWLVLILCATLPALGQTIDHWETVVYDSMIWHFWPGSSDPGADWNSPDFNDDEWQEGSGGIGYGDEDDRTVISPVVSVFLRKKFTITNREQIEMAILHVDYDDGFIAYLNGVEIARSFMNSGSNSFNQGSNGLHEALIYQGLAPESFPISSDQVDELLVAGENTLAIQVHNENINSSDLSSSVFFSVGITNESVSYLPTPTWFVAPIVFSSNLPIIVINTNGQIIQDENRIVVDMGIIDNSVNGINRNQLSDPFNSYEGKISIEVRGESSQMFPKKSYSIETQDAAGNNLNAALLGMPAENDWVLYAPYSDKTMMRNVLAFKVGRDLGDYAPRTRFAELVINDDYVGVYVLMERIKQDKNRVNVAKLLPQDITGDELTGGYLLRVDKLDGNDYPGWRATPTPQLAGENDITFQYYDPKGEDLVNAQHTYIRNYMRSVQNSLTSATFTNEETGYRNYFDVMSTLNFMIVNEIGKNIDGYVFSTYLYKDKDSDGGKLHMGPLWDFNLAFGNVDYLDNAQFAPGWMWTDQYRMYWFRRMVQDPLFISNLRCRWQELRGSFLTNAYFANAIDSMATVLQESQQRNFERWPIIGTYVWPNQFVGRQYSEEIGFIKRWILDRLIWMDTNLAGACEPLVTEVTGVEDNLNDISIFPNPFEYSVTIQTNKEHEIKYLQILDVTGREVFNASFSETEYQWQGTSHNGERVPKGVYIIRVNNSRGLLIGSQKILKK